MLISGWVRNKAWKWPYFVHMGRDTGMCLSLRELHGYGHGLGQGHMSYIECPYGLGHERFIWPCEPHGLPTRACDPCIEEKFLNFAKNSLSF
ncbi:hypothetical protein F383_03868 [Gossypium arboreum]|uniref:Uncharacterized protein n=1 Tax=Gossypium arboreum TaxID=29729 RepID=A0A0B0PAU4_GOSAR|nr:hypothetical protein F383_03868 [Gossypium arboreum]